MNISNSKKLLIIDPSDVRGGAEEYGLKIASAASNQGWEVHSAFPMSEDTVSLVKELTIKKIKYHNLLIDDTKDMPKTKKINDFLRFIKTLFLLIRLKPNSVLIVLPSINRGFGSIIACSVLKTKASVVFQLAPLVSTFSKSKLSLYDWARSRNQQWIAVSEQNRDVINKSFKIVDNQVICIHNGVPITRENNTINPEKIRAELREKLGLPLNKKLLLTVGRLHPQKGHHLIIEAAKYITKEFNDVIFVWLGKGEYKDYLERQIEDYGVSSKILLLGHCEDVVRFLASSDIFIFPTYYEGLPFALAEAMSNNLPVVASNAGGVSELIDNAVHGLLFQSGDSCDLYHTIRWALCNGNKMQEMAINAKSRIKEFSDEKMIDQTLFVLS